MPILLRTQIERTAKAPIPACHARVGGLCGFRSPAERTHPAAENRTLRQRAGSLRARQTQKKNGCRRISAEGEAASGEAGEKAWRFSAPARPLLPAVRAVSGDENGAFLRLSKMEWRCNFKKAAKRQ